MAGTIYIRDNQWFSQLGLYKVGKATSAKDRSSTYLTSEPIPGKYVMVVEVGDKMDIVDKLMKIFGAFPSSDPSSPMYNIATDNLKNNNTYSNLWNQQTSHL